MHIKLLKYIHFSHILLIKGLISLFRNGPIYTFKRVHRFVARKIKPVFFTKKSLIREFIPPLRLPETYHEPELLSYNGDKNFSPKLLAYYLPQFYPFPENDEWWGKGFTEWTNVRKAKPLFPGHYQPREPHKDIGYYSLDNVEALRKQVKLCEESGIYGFCFYHYWFGGKRLMDKPVDMLLAHKDIKLNFCLCWANESWTRSWDGNPKNTLIDQPYSSENDLQFISDLRPYLEDPRYIRVSGKPLVMVYRIDLFPNPAATVNRWRTWCREQGIGEIYLLGTAIRGVESPISISFDALVERPFYEWHTESITDHAHDLGASNKHQGVVQLHHEVSAFYRNHTPAQENGQILRSVGVMWDPSPRHADRCHLIHNTSPDDYQLWLQECIKYTEENIPKTEQFIFINAWNEWAEGAYLEPDTKLGYAMLNATTRALKKDPIPRKRVIYVNSVFGGGTYSYICDRIASNLHNNELVIIQDENNCFRIYKSNNLEEYETIVGSSLADIIHFFGITDIIVSSLVLNTKLEESIDQIVNVAHTYPNVNLTYQFHDYFALCPRYTFIDDTGKYCNLEGCASCLTLENKDIRSWRSKWRTLLFAVDVIEVFSKSSADYIHRVFPEFSDKVRVRPHSMDYLKDIRKPVLTKEPLKLGILGELSHHKGLDVINNIQDILTENGIETVLIGESLSDKVLDSRVKCLGRYNIGDLPEIIEKEDINVFFISSIWPETFSYTTHEVIEFDIPVLCFNIGAQAEVVNAYRKGMVIDLGSSPQKILEAIKALYKP